jgi:hypothetical protein
MKYVYSFTHDRLLERDLENDHQCDHSLEYLKTICNEPIIEDNPQFVVSRMIAHLKENYSELLL